MNQKTSALSLCAVLSLTTFASTIDAQAEVTYGEMVGKMESYTMKEGEDLFDVARRNDLAIEHLAFANGFPITTLKAPAGTEIVIPNRRVLPKNPPHNGLVLNLPERGVYLFREGKFVRFYPTSIGDERNFLTKPGTYHIIEKIKDPTWYPPEWSDKTEPIPPGPDNPLGDRWIGLSLHRTGIHGTNQPLNIGNSVTHGCIRAYPSMLHELYDQVEVGWPVRIEYENVKLSQNKDGQMLITTFPDVYNLSNTMENARKKIHRLGLEKMLNSSNLSSIIDLNLGFPIKIERSTSVRKELEEQF